MTNSRHDQRSSVAAGCGFVPPWLVQRLAEEPGRPGVLAGTSTLAVDEAMRSRRALRTRGVGAAPGGAGDAAGTAWVVHDAGNAEELPGRPVRSAGDPATGDAAVDEAAEAVEAVLRLLREELGRDSFDDRGAPVSVTVHYGRGYANAFWDGEQLVFGDGDGRVFARFTRSADVVAHELGHAVTQESAGLVYEGQSGALNEHVSDVLAAMFDQWRAGQGPDEADWLIGRDLFLPGVQARALRDMAAPGTAYDDPTLGRDPQVGHLDDYVETRDDNGGVHLNSGIPNRAFVLAARAIGGASWQGAGVIWMSVLTSGALAPDADFAAFARATVAAAGERAEAVAEAWRGVGVEPAGAAAPADPGSAEPPAGAPAAVVEVRRSGGFAGRRDAGRVALDEDDPRAGEVAAIVSRVRFVELTGGRLRQAQPDRFVYAFVVDGSETVLPEQDLSDDLQRLAALVLGEAE